VILVLIKTLRALMEVVRVDYQEDLSKDKIWCSNWMEQKRGIKNRLYASLGSLQITKRRIEFRGGCAFMGRYQALNCCFDSQSNSSTPGRESSTTVSFLALCVILQQYMSSFPPLQNWFHFGILTSDTVTLCTVVRFRSERQDLYRETSMA